MLFLLAIIELSIVVGLLWYLHKSGTMNFFLLILLATGLSIGLSILNGTVVNVLIGLICGSLALRWILGKPIR